MLNVLVPIDGSDNALRALRHVISPASICREPGQIQLLNVQPPVASGVVRLFLSREDLTGYYQEEAEKALGEALGIDPNNSTNPSNKACIKALRGRSDAAIDYLERAAVEGFTDFTHLERDTDLNSLRHQQVRDPEIASRTPRQIEIRDGKISKQVDPRLVARNN